MFIGRNADNPRIIGLFDGLLELHEQADKWYYTRVVAR